jgi:formylglycine-generating enzyme required for sulfatase activity
VTIRAALVPATAIFLIALGGCQLVLDLGDKVYIDRADGGTTSASSSSSSGTTLPPDGGGPGTDASSPPTTCPTDVHGATLVPVKSPAGGVTCIDATEVTYAQYAAFLKATDDGSNVSVQPTECGWNTSFQPDNGCVTYNWPEPFICDPSAQSCDDYPRTCVNWCQAAAYCKWAGKRLCGAIRGGSLDPAKAMDPNEGQWSNACQSGEKRHIYSYGDTFSSTACRTFPKSAPTRSPVNVSGYPDCQSREPGYTNVLDLNGNVSEWEDACAAAATPADATCFARGGSFLDETETKCNAVFTRQRGRADPDIGFRCCSK